MGGTRTRLTIFVYDTCLRICLSAALQVDPVAVATLAVRTLPASIPVFEARFRSALASVAFARFKIPSPLTMSALAMSALFAYCVIRSGSSAGER